MLHMFILRMFKPLLVLGAACLCLYNYSPPMVSAAQRCCEGEEWLKWSKETQTVYLTGLLLGTERGFRKGCFEGLVQGSSSPTEINERALRGCLGKTPSFTKDISVYVQKVTEVYQTYPNDRSLSVRDVFFEFSDDKNRTAKQVHQRLVVEGKRD
jgi:hypothetical protein